MPDQPGNQSDSLELAPQTSVGDAIRRGAQRLAETSAGSARLDAQLLLAHVLGTDRSWLFAHFDTILTAGQSAGFAALIARRHAHEPVAYLVGYKEFYGIAVQVDRRVLIPRPETEMLVDAVLKLAAARAAQRLLVADVGAGSGAIALALASHAPGVHVYAVDVSADALAVAAANRARLQLQERITLLQGDLLAPLPERVDVVVANLPYVTSADYSALEPGVGLYEPRLALEAGAQGLDVIARLLPQLPAALNPGGVALLEIGYNQGEWMLDLVARTLPAARATLDQDLQGHDRMVTIAL